MNYTITLKVNGRTVQRDVPAHLTLLEFIRSGLQLTGTKHGCGNGECGACTVIMDGKAVRACLILAVEANGCAVETIEGLVESPLAPFAGELPGAVTGTGHSHPEINGASPVGEGVGAGLHPIQRAFLAKGAVQCGFCTPGMIMAAKALYDRNPNPDRAAVVEALGGHLCRCTGYQPIIDAVLAVQTE